MRINPPLYFNHTLSNAQVAALGSVLFGTLMLLAVRNRNLTGGPAHHTIVLSHPTPKSSS